MEFRSALFIVPDESELESLRSSLHYASYNPQVLIEKSAGGAKEFKRVISDPTTRFGAVYISANLVSISPLKLLRAARENHLATPVYLLSNHPILADLEIHRLGLQGRLPIPKSFDDLPVSPQLALAAYQRAEEAVNLVHPLPRSGAEVSSPEFVPVRLEEFYSQGVSPFDVFLRVGAQHHVKVMSANESLENSRALAYRAQGVRELYVRRSALGRCLSYHEMLSQRLLKMPEISNDLKLTQIEMLAMELEAVAAASHLPASCVEDAGTFVDSLFEIVDHAEMTPKKMATEFLKRYEHLTHASSVTFLAALLSIPLKIENPKIRAQLGLAALFHDIGISRLPAHLWNEAIPSRSVEDQVLFEQHPVEAVKILSSFSEFELIGLQAIEQHHERRNHRGFPRKLGAGQIHLFAEIVGLADELVHELKERAEAPIQERLSLFGLRVRDSFSSEVFEAFAHCFLQG